jgi:hypothetical protein
MSHLKVDINQGYINFKSRFYNCPEIEYLLEKTFFVMK